MIGDYVKIKRRSHRNKIYYKWSWVHDFKMFEEIENLPQKYKIIKVDKE